MSADNGIYILQTPSESGKKEYRVAHAMAIENLTYYDPYGDEIAMWDYFNESEVYVNKEDVYKVALEMLEVEYYIEYGIQFIQLNKVFPSKRPKCPDHRPEVDDEWKHCFRCGKSEVL